MTDAYPLAYSESSANPAGIDKPAPGIVLQHPGLKHLGILKGMLDHERCAKTGTEGDLRFVFGRQSYHLGVTTTFKVDSSLTTNLSLAALAVC